MKKKVLGSLSTIVIMAVAVFNTNLNTNNTELSMLHLENVEALAFTEWWDRPDYDCVDVICYSMWQEYYAQAGRYVGEGKGSVAHSWNCGSGC